MGDEKEERSMYDTSHRPREQNDDILHVIFVYAHCAQTAAPTDMLSVI